MTANDVTSPQVTESDPEVTSFDRKSPGRDCGGPKLTYTVRFTSYKALLAGGGGHVTGNDIT